jgi:hypothetical protein
MGLERRTVTYQEQPYTRFICTKVESKEEMVELAGVVLGGNYFYGGVLDTGSALQVYFGQGPDHDVFDQMIREITGSDGCVRSCQIGINRRTKLIEGIIFLYDPGKNIDNVSITETDLEGKKRRITRILALVRAVSPTICESRIPVGWLGEGDHTCEYVYLPQNDLLKKF